MGLDRVNLWEVVRDVLIPAFAGVLAFVCPPHAFARVIIPLLVKDPWAQFSWYRWVAVCRGVLQAELRVTACCLSNA